MSLVSTTARLTTKVVRKSITRFAKITQVQLCNPDSVGNPGFLRVLDETEKYEAHPIKGKACFPSLWATIPEHDYESNQQIKESSDKIRLGPSCKNPPHLESPNDVVPATRNFSNSDIRYPE